MDSACADDNGIGAVSKCSGCSRNNATTATATAYGIMSTTTAANQQVINICAHAATE